MRTGLFIVICPKEKGRDIPAQIFLLPYNRRTSMAFGRMKSSKFRERQSRLAETPKVSSNGQAVAGTGMGKSGTRKYLREYLRWLRPYWRSIAFLFVIASIYAVFDKVWPLAIKFAI